MGRLDISWFSLSSIASLIARRAWELLMKFLHAAACAGCSPAAFFLDLAGLPACPKKDMAKQAQQSWETVALGFPRYSCRIHTAWGARLLSSPKKMEKKQRRPLLLFFFPLPLASFFNHIFVGSIVGFVPFFWVPVPAAMGWLVPEALGVD